MTAPPDRHDRSFAAAPVGGAAAARSGPAPHAPSLRLRILALAVGLLPGAEAADDLRVDQLRQDVRELQRMVREQERRIRELERELLTRSPAPPGDRGRGALKRGAEPPPWLSVTRWSRIEPGMTEADVVALLGPPSSTRSTSGGGRALLYALELSADGFLSGRVELVNGRVTAVSPPVLR